MEEPASFSRRSFAAAARLRRMEWLILTDSEEAFPACLAHSEPMSVHEHNPAFTSTFADDLPHFLEIDDHRTVDTNELFRIEGVGELLNRFPEHEISIREVQAAVVVRRLDPFDLENVDEEVFCAI